MSTFSKNAFSLLSEDGDVRPQPVPVKETAKPVEQPKNDKRSPKAAAGAQKRGADKRRGGDKRQGGRPQRGRQFDRHSATGLVDSEKKEKQGWGHPETAEAEAAADAVNNKDAATEEAAAAPAEPEEVVKTLDEYLAEKANKNLKVSLPEARKANEGSDDAKWKDTVAFTKTEEPEYLPAKEKAAKKEKAVKTKKEYVDIEQRFQEKPRFQREQRPARGRGGRNNSNGRRGGRQSNGVNVNLQDDSAFPSLGAASA